MEQPRLHRPGRQAPDHRLQVFKRELEAAIRGDAVRRGQGCPYPSDASFVSKSLSNWYAEGRSLVRNRPLTLVAGAGFEPATSGL